MKKQSICLLLLCFFGMTPFGMRVIQSQEILPSGKPSRAPVAIAQGFQRKVYTKTNTLGKSTMFEVDYDSAWRETLSTVHDSAEVYKKALYLDAVVDFQFRLENLVEFIKKYLVNGEISGLEEAARACISLRQASAATAEEEFYEQTLSLFEKYYPVYAAERSAFLGYYERMPAADSPVGAFPKALRMSWMRPEHRDYSDEEIGRMIFSMSVDYGFNFIKIDQMRQIVTDAVGCGQSRLLFVQHLGILGRISRRGHGIVGEQRYGSPDRGKRLGHEVVVDGILFEFHEFLIACIAVNPECAVAGGWYFHSRPRTKLLSTMRTSATPAIEKLDFVNIQTVQWDVFKQALQSREK